MRRSRMVSPLVPGAQVNKASGPLTMPALFREPGLPGFFAL